MEGRFSYDVEYDMVSFIVDKVNKQYIKFISSSSFQDYAIQKLLLYYDTPYQWPVAYEPSKVRWWLP